MRLRLVVSAVLLLIGIGLPVAAVLSNGPPWGFRGRAAVVLESVGGVEVYPSAERARREGLPTGALPGKAGLALFSGDEVRVGTLSHVALRRPAADVVLGDGARAIVEPAWIALGRGIADVEVKAPSPEQPEPAAERVRNDGLGADVRLEPGRYHLAADGRGAFFLVVHAGRAELEGGSASLPPIGPGQMLRHVRGAAPEVVDVPKALTLEASFERLASSAEVSAVGIVKGRAEPGTQVYVDGKLSYPDPDGRFTVNVPPGDADVVVFARDPAGNVAKKTLRRGG